MRRAVLIPVDAGSADASLRIADWYLDNMRLPGDRLVLVSVLVPSLQACGPAQQEAVPADSGCVGLGPGNSGSSSSDSAADADACVGSPIEATMDRQLAESCLAEEHLAARLKARGCSSFRYIHAFGRSRPETLARIAEEQRAWLVLATYDSIAQDSWDLGCALRLFRRARLALQLVPPQPV